MRHKVTTRKHILYACVAFVTIVLGMQLVAATAWTADMANAGPCVTIIQLSQDPDSDWATNDLVARLSEFIHDDPFITNRINVVKTNDPYYAESITDRIVIYVSHGGPIGIVTGDRLTSWRTMAEIVTESKAIMHLFTSCYSRNIIRYGDSTSGEKLYTVPGARPAEVTNVEITTTVMLAFGFDANEVEQYRTAELAAAKEMIESEVSVHIMDFDQIILSEIEAIDETYSDTYTDTHRVYRFTEEDTLIGTSGLSDLPYEIRTTISLYFRGYLDHNLQTVILPFVSCTVSYIRNYYYEAEWIVDDPEPDPDDPPYPDPDDPIREPGDPPVGPESVSLFYITAAVATTGHWEYGPNIFCGGTYSGLVSFGYPTGLYPYVLIINVTASGPTIDAYGETEIDSFSLQAIAPKGTYVMNQKVDGVWSEPVVGRDPARTGGLWTDVATKTDYEYTPNIPPVPYRSYPGTLSTNGDYYTITSIPGDGSDWHGPSFIKTLPSYFKMSDLGSLSANMSFIHGTNGLGMSQTCVNLYDENMKIAISLMIADDWAIETGGQKQYFSAIYYNENGVAAPPVISAISIGDTIGTVTMRYDPLVGLWGKYPGEYEHLILTHNLINKDRLIKYIGISSYRYGWRALLDNRIYNIRLSYAGSEYTVFHDNCNDMDNFHQSSDYGYGVIADGTIEVPSGQSYMTLSDVAAHFPTTGWSFRKSHILNGASGAGTGYQIKITAHSGSGTDSGQDVYLSSHAKTDFGDVRFVSSDGSTLLDYWCESVVAGTKADFWVKVSDNLDYDQTIYIDYGNGAAESLSDGEATFLMYEDWSSQSTEAWTKWKDESGGSATFESTDATHGYVYKINAGNGNYGDEFHSDTETDQPFSLMFRANIPSTAASYQYARVGAGWAGEYTLTYIDTYSSTTRRFQVYDDNGISTSQTMDSSHFGNFHTYQITRPRDGTTTKLYIDGVLDETANIASDAQTVYYASFGVQDAEYYLYTDWFAARKYLSSEPTHGAWNVIQEGPNLSDWSYRKSHHLNGVPEAGTNYQIPITAHYGSGTDSGQDVYLNSHSKTDFSDIRFAASDGSTLLDYWCESVVASNYAKFWVKISENLDYDQDIYIAYGNNAATSMSNGDATFIFFDDFNDASIDTNKWDTYGTCSESSGYATLTTAKSTNTAHACLRSDNTYSFQNTAFAARFQYDQWGNREWGISMADSDYVPLCYQISGASSTYYDHYIDTDGGGYDEYSNWASSGLDTFFRRECKMTTTSTTWTIDGSQHTYSAKTMPAATGKIFLGFYVYGYSGAHNTAVTELDFDWVYVRKSVDSDNQVHGDWGVEEGTAGWHGPNYVHVLDRPFRLFQLSEFSVLAELIQGSSSLMGKTGVALYDNNKQCILTVEWCDDSGGYVDGWLKAIFYPQSGAPVQRFLWYGDSSMLTGVRLWWDPYTGGPGAIYVRSDVAPYDYLLGACVNASRVVSYVVVMGQGYALNPILDMRIQDINIEADINRHVPTIPEPIDNNGVGDDAEVDQADEAFSLNFLDLMVATWELVNWWPRLFLRFMQTLDSIFSVEASFDLIGDAQMHSCSVVTEADQTYTESQIENGLGQYDLSFEHMVLLGACIVLEGVLGATLQSLRTAACGMAWYGLAVAAWFFSFIGWIVLLDYLVETGINHPVENAAMLLAFMFYLFPNCISLIIAGFGIIGDEFWLACNTGLLGQLDQWLGWRNFLLGIIEFVAFLICAYYFAKNAMLCITIALQYLGLI